MRHNTMSDTHSTRIWALTQKVATTMAGTLLVVLVGICVAAAVAAASEREREPLKTH